MATARRSHHDGRTQAQPVYRRSDRRSRSSRQGQRTASSVWLPWLSGLLALLSIAGVTALLGGRVDGGVAVPTSVLDLQQAAVVSAAQQIRNALEGGTQDLTQLAASLDTAVDDARLVDRLNAFAKHYRRYRALYVVDANRLVVAKVGSAPHPESVPQRARRAGVTDAVKIDNLPVVLQYAPFTRAGKAMVVVAEYELSRLRFALNTLRPATAWLVNNKSEVIASTAGFVAFERLAGDDLAKLATGAQPSVSLSQSGVDSAAILAQAPVRDADPTPIVPRWRLVSTRSVSTVLLPQTRARDQALLAGLALVIVTLGVFGWMYVAWLRPLRQLTRDVDRIADGDLSRPVQVRRDDEIGLVARAVERIRVGLVRDLSGHGVEHTQLLRTLPGEADP